MYREFPNIQIPTFLREWEDTSWHNDATASSVLDLDFGMIPLSLRVWVNSDTIVDREMFPDFKYVVVLEYSEDGEEILSEAANTEEQAIRIITLFKNKAKEVKS